MRKRLLLPFLVLVLQGCMYNNATTFKNDEIEASERQDIKLKNGRLLKALKDSNNSTLREIGSPDFVKHLRSRIEDVVWLFREGQLQPDFKEFDAFHNLHSSAPANAMLESEEHGYTFTYTHKEKETYVSMITVPFRGTDDYLVTVMYGLIDGEWKVNDVMIGLVAVTGKTAPMFYEEAKKQALNGFLIDAFILCDDAEMLLKPCGDLLKYKDEDKIELARKTYNDRVTKTYNFANALAGVPTQPQLLRVGPLRIGDGYHYTFNYGTSLQISDSVAIKQEYMIVKEALKGYLREFDFKKDKIYYQAINQAEGESCLFTDNRK